MRDNNKESCKAYKLRQRAKLIALLGGKCVICGFDDERALQVDHPEGTKMKPGANRRGGVSLYQAILTGKLPASDYQLLCANCNWIKRHTLKEHSHCYSR